MPMKHKTDISDFTVLKISELPVLSVGQMIKVDHLMENLYRISLEQMMENAGRSLATLASKIFDGNVTPANAHVAVVCGAGNNGGGGMVAARFLHNRGYNVTVILVGSDANLKPIPATRWRTLNKIAIKTIMADGRNAEQDIANADFIIDAMIGYGLKGKPRELASHLIQAINAKNGNVIALDIPSGLNGDKGLVSPFCIRATATMTLALPKKGLISTGAINYVGELFLADIGVPPELYQHLDLPSQQIFKAPIVKLDR
jgi:NAD(P)H-hydrate epimerase